MVFSLFKKGNGASSERENLPLTVPPFVPESEPLPLERLGPILWQDIRFGMTLAEVRELHPEAVGTKGDNRLGDGSTAPLEIPRLRLADHDFHVLFYCREGRVTQVTIATLGGPTMHEFRQVTGALRLRYGQEVEMTENPDGFSHAEWLSPDGINIALVCSPEIGVLNIVFQNRYSDAARQL